MPFAPTDFNETKCQHLLTIEIIQAQLAKYCFNNLFYLVCSRINCQIRSTSAAIFTNTKVATKLCSGQFELNVNQKSTVIIALKKKET